MQIGKLFIAIVLLIYPLTVQALSEEATAGKSLFAVCHACHDQALVPPLGPPMWSVQRIYKRNYASKDEFITKMVDFVKAPSLEKAVHEMAVQHLGLMPAMPLPDDTLRKIATYIYEAQFPPPCDHWRNAFKDDKFGDDKSHIMRHQQMLERFCNNKE